MYFNNIYCIFALLANLNDYIHFDSLMKEKYGVEHIEKPLEHPILTSATVPQNEALCKSHPATESLYKKCHQNLKKKAYYYRKKNSKFRQQIREAKKTLNLCSFQNVSKYMSHSAKIFTKLQMTQSSKRPRGRRFTTDEKILALSLYKQSPKAYRLLTRLFVLPSSKTLVNALSRVKILPGINNHIFEHLKKVVKKLKPSQRYCSLLFDEMKLKAQIQYNEQEDKIVGFEDAGTDEFGKPLRTLNFADHALVFMIRGIRRKFKQPICYSFCYSATKSTELVRLIKSVIIATQSTGLKVVATICDQSSLNVSAINKLLNETKKEYSENGKEYNQNFFESNSQKIFPIYDPPHLIKGIRNNLLTINLQFNFNGTLMTSKWEH